jgi:ABC-type nitrate/sulfonate/bicarbonate transport system permease component
MTLSWALVVAAELIAAQVGLGFMIMDATTFFRIPYVFVGIITIGLIGLALEAILLLAERRLLHWRGKQ